MALEVGDFVLAEKAFDALGERSDDTVFVLLGLVPVETHIVSLDAELFEVSVQFMVLVGDVEKSL